MGGWLAVIPLRVQLVALAVLAFALGLLGFVRWSNFVAVQGERARQDRAKAQAILRREEIENEVEALDDDALRDRALVWVRNPRRQ